MISVCLATYNGGRYLECQLKSILSQLGADDEIVVSDDGSKDSTLDIINSFNDSRIKVFRNECHGVIHNFGNALCHANGDYIFLSDQDDEWMPDKVKICMEYLKHYHCVTTDCYVSDSEGNITAESFFKLNRTKTGKWYNLLLKNGYLGCCMAFRKEITDKILPFPDDIPMHDIWIGDVAAFKYSMAFVPDRLIKYRRHGDNTSSAAEKSRSGIMEKIGYRWRIIKHLLFA